jgi:anti-sigma28 factor (negative regulator of flagellin synthesis)
VGKPKVEDTAQVEKRDRVEISDAGRARAAKLERLSQLDPERVAELRRRILSGAYDADEVVAEVARRLIERGDV